MISCAGAGQDGETQAGIAQAFTDNSDGTLTDIATGFMWEKLDDNNTGGIHDQDDYYTWTNTFAVKVTTLNTPPCFANHCDWRMPNHKEWMSVLDLEEPTTVPPAFRTGCVPGCTVLNCSCTGQFGSGIWTSTTLALGGGQSNAWYVGLGGGEFSYTGKDNTLYMYARAVRGGL